KARKEERKANRAERRAKLKDFINDTFKSIKDWAEARRKAKEAGFDDDELDELEEAMEFDENGEVMLDEDGEILTEKSYDEGESDDDEDDDDEPEAEEKKTNWPLILGIGGGVLALIVIVVVIILVKKRK
ncbi:MAG: hypothetical protein II394_01410, partial [Bacteroidales bacterium]|nr:hypothetical protein [Bacteroidales bacterium]